MSNDVSCSYQRIKKCFFNNSQQKYHRILQLLDPRDHRFHYHCKKNDGYKIMTFHIKIEIERHYLLFPCHVRFSENSHKLGLDMAPRLARAHLSFTSECVLSSHMLFTCTPSTSWHIRRTCAKT